MLGISGESGAIRQRLSFFAAGIRQGFREMFTWRRRLRLRCVILSISPAVRESYMLAVENLGDRWRCDACGDMSGAYEAAREADVMILCPCRQTEELLHRASCRGMSSPPYLLGDGVAHPLLDGAISLSGLSALPGWLARRESAGVLPLAAAVRLPEMTCLARGLLRALSVPEGLRAWDFLPDMAAMAALHPALMSDLRARLYPIVARRHGMTPGAVERSLRLCVESAWSRGRLDALERFFGQSVDPERGKPTNREFLNRVCGQLASAARRLE